MKPESTVDELIALATSLRGTWCEDRIAPWRIRLFYGADAWRLTLRLDPYGVAGSTSDDWKLSGWLAGRAASVIGIKSPSPVIEDIATTHPAEAMHWVWPNNGAEFAWHTNGPVNPLPDGWKSKPFDVGTITGVQYDRHGVRVIVTDEPMGTKPTRHISASFSGGRLTQQQIELIRCLFGFPGQESILDSVNPSSGVWHLWQTRPDEFEASEGCR